MNTTTRISTAERLGRWVGRGWRAYARGERRVANWLASKGMPAAGATVLLWAAKLVVLGVLFYLAFWLAVLVVLLVFLAMVADGHDTVESDPPKPALRDGPGGYGLYSDDGYRIDSYDSFDETR